MRPFTALLPYISRQWTALCVILGLTALSSVVVALQPWPLKVVVDYALTQAPLPAPLESFLRSVSPSPTPLLLIALAALSSFGLFLLHGALDAALAWASTVAGQRMVYDLSADLFRKLQSLSLSFHRRRTVGDSLSRLTEDSWCVYTIAEGLLISPGQHLLTFITVAVVGWSLDPTLAALSLAIAPALGGSALFFGGRIKRKARLTREAHSRLLSFVHQTLASLPLVQAFNRAEVNRRHFRHLAADAVTLSQRDTLVKGAHSLIGGLVTTVGSAVILYVGGRRVLSGALSIGSLIVFVTYLRAMQNAAQALLSVFARVKSEEASVDRVMEILNAHDGVEDSPEAAPLAAGGSGERGHVRVEGVVFGYTPDRPVLKGISVEAVPGETVALVGPTGAGKSTLVSLIPRFFDPWEGRVLVDGSDVRALRLKSLREQIALVLQEPFLLPLSVAENIAYGRPGATRGEIVAAAVAANADEFIRNLPQGYDTVIGERGATLSGGEKQRLSLARAFIRAAPILILDEPTAALDVESEALILDAMGRLMKGRTAFIIAHRLTTIHRADRIVVIQDGAIVEMGSHEALMKSGGAYRTLQKLQATRTRPEVPA